MIATIIRLRLNSFAEYTDETLFLPGSFKLQESVVDVTHDWSPIKNIQRYKVERKYIICISNVICQIDIVFL